MLTWDDLVAFSDKLSFVVVAVFVVSHAPPPANHCQHTAEHHRRAQPHTTPLKCLHGPGPVREGTACVVNMLHTSLATTTPAGTGHAPGQHGVVEASHRLVASREDGRGGCKAGEGGAQGAQGRVTNERMHGRMR